MTVVPHIAGQGGGVLVGGNVVKCLAQFPVLIDGWEERAPICVCVLLSSRLVPVPV